MIDSLTINYWDHISYLFNCYLGQPVLVIAIVTENQMESIPIVIINYHSAITPGVTASVMGTLLIFTFNGNFINFNYLLHHYCPLLQQWMNYLNPY